jgi:hypothetical protein
MYSTTTRGHDLSERDQTMPLNTVSSCSSAATVATYSFQGRRLTPILITEIFGRDLIMSSSLLRQLWPPWRDRSPLYRERRQDGYDPQYRYVQCDPLCISMSLIASASTTLGDSTMIYITMSLRSGNRRTPEPPVDAFSKYPHRARGSLSEIPCADSNDYRFPDTPP